MSVRLGSRASIRTSLLVNSLGLEMAAVKGHQLPPGDQKRMSLMQTDSSSSSTRFESDSRSSHSSGSGTPDPRGAATTTTSTTSTTCQRCSHNQQQSANSNSSSNNIALEANLKSELEAIKAEMKKANLTINALQEREKQMKVR